MTLWHIDGCGCINKVSQGKICLVESCGCTQYQDTNIKFFALCFIGRYNFYALIK